MVVEQDDDEARATLFLIAGEKVGGEGFLFRVGLTTDDGLPGGGDECFLVLRKFFCQ